MPRKQQSTSFDSTPDSHAPDWSDSEYLMQNEFDQKAARRIELKLQQDAIDQELEELNVEIGAMLATANYSSVRFGHYMLTLGQSTKGGRLLKEKLLENGVTVDQIEKSTTPKEPGSYFIRVMEVAPEEGQ